MDPEKLYEGLDVFGVEKERFLVETHYSASVQN